MKKEHAPIPSLPMAKCPYLNSCTFQMKVAGGQTPASLSKSECGKPNLNGCSRASEKGSDSKGVNFLRPRESCKVTFDFSKPYTTSHSRMAGFPALLLLLALTGKARRDCSCPWGRTFCLLLHSLHMARGCFCSQREVAMEVGHWLFERGGYVQPTGSLDLSYMLLDPCFCSQKLCVLQRRARS